MAKHPLKIGLTGGIGSGKSTVCKLFQQLGIAIVDSDAISHALTAPRGAAIEAISKAFGPSAITSDGAMDRVFIRKQVFDQPERRKALESILHPLIRLESDQQISIAKSPYVLLDIPLLVESLVQAGCTPANRSQFPIDRFARILVVDCLETEQRERVTKRNGFSGQQLDAIMASQVNRKTRLSYADDIIDNFDEQPDLLRQVQTLDAKYRELAATPGQPSKVQ
jgi:dephospho-CoA kinase